MNKEVDAAGIIQLYSWDNLDESGRSYLRRKGIENPELQLQELKKLIQVQQLKENNVYLKFDIVELDQDLVVKISYSNNNSGYNSYYWYTLGYMLPPSNR